MGPRVRPSGYQGLASKIRAASQFPDPFYSQLGQAVGDTETWGMREGLISFRLNHIKLGFF